MCELSRLHKRSRVHNTKRGQLQCVAGRVWRLWNGHDGMVGLLLECHYPLASNNNGANSDQPIRLTVIQPILGSLKQVDLYYVVASLPPIAPSALLKLLRHKFSKCCWNAVEWTDHGHIHVQSTVSGRGVQTRHKTVLSSCFRGNPSFRCCSETTSWHHLSISQAATKRQKLFLVSESREETYSLTNFKGQGHLGAGLVKTAVSVLYSPTKAAIVSHICCENREKRFWWFTLSGLGK